MDGNSDSACEECGGSGVVEVLGDYLPGSSRTPYDDATEERCETCDGASYPHGHGYHVFDAYKVAKKLAPFVVDVDSARAALAGGRDGMPVAHGLADGSKPNRRTGRRHVSERVRVALAAMEGRAAFLEDADAAEYDREIAAIRHCIAAFRDALEGGR